MAEAAGTISDGKIREALQLLEVEHRELELRKTGLTAYLNVKSANRLLEKQKAGLQEEIAALKARIQADTEAHAKTKEMMTKGVEDLRETNARIHEAQRDADQKELAGLKASIAKAKKQAADVEKESGQKVEAANQYLAGVLAGNQKTMEDLDKEIQAKRDQIARLDEEFRSIAARHGLGAAISG